MSIERDHFDGPITFACDSCGELLGTDLDEFSEAHAMAKREGWKTRKVVDEWMHFCPDCEA